MEGRTFKQALENAQSIGRDAVALAKTLLKEKKEAQRKVANLGEVIDALQTEAQRLRRALEAAKREIRSLAQSGTERIQALGGEADPWEQTAEISIKFAGIDDALADGKGGQ